MLRGPALVAVGRENAREPVPVDALGVYLLKTVQWSLTSTGAPRTAVHAVHFVSRNVAFSKFIADPVSGNLKRKNHSYGLLAVWWKSSDLSSTGSVSDPSPRVFPAPCPAKIRVLVVAASDWLVHVTISTPFW